MEDLGKKTEKKGFRIIYNLLHLLYFLFHVRDRRFLSVRSLVFYFVKHKITENKAGYVISFNISEPLKCFQNNLKLF